MFKPAFEGHRETCYFCDNRWGKCTCAFPDCAVYDPNAPGFEWGCFFITAPNVSECTRFFVDPVVYYGEAFTSSDLARVTRRSR